MARQNFIGLVVSQGKMQKTVKVRVERKVFNKRINKELFRRKDFLVHDEGEITREGDLVRIESTRPLSKWKSFAIAEIIRNKGQQFAQFEAQAKVDVLNEETEKTKQFLERREERLGYQNGQLLRDIRVLQSHFANRSEQELQAQELSEEIQKIKERYGVDNFTPQTLTTLVKLDVNAIEEDLVSQKEKIDNAQSRIANLMADREKAIEFLKQNQVNSPESLQKNIMKNLVRKYVMKEL
ncbi:Small ribosomal subunit protein uS17m [Nakaseomyces bracarensis]|uniref:Small ribosomal subunit protein uS17m n=1 Tax=Nakaseomyces bracarensis TaxID=273131 RepID=A0ABR4NPC4_9SACH